MIDIFNSKELAHIDKCDIIISVIIRTRNRSQSRSVYSVKAFIISSNSECLVLVHYMLFLSNRDFLFELTETNLSIYAYLINLNISLILMHDERDHVLKVSRNFRLRILMKLDYFNVYWTNSKNVSKSTIRHFKSKHKFNWFQKVIVACAKITTTENNMILSSTTDKNNRILSNEIIIHNLFELTVKFLISLMDKYLNLWIDQEVFVKFYNCWNKFWY